MIKAIRKRARPDNLKNQVRAGGQSFARKLYLYCVIAVFATLAWIFTGHWFFLDAEGQVSKERVVIAPDYAARVLAIHVKPGDKVVAGQHIATLQSREILDTIAELTTRRATVMSREAQITGRIETIRKLLPSAIERRKRAIETQKQLASLSVRGLTTGPRVQDAQREFYEAEKEESSLTTESKALMAEFINVQTSRTELDALIAQVQSTYNGGKVLAGVDGIVGARVPHLGQIVKSGEALVDLYRGDMFVLAYMPVGRFYSIRPGDPIRVTDGQQSFMGRVDRIENVTDALPPEFQVSFRAQERQQIFRVAFDSPPPFAIQAKVKLSGAWSPNGLASFGKGAALALGETVTGWLGGSGAQAGAGR